MTELKTLIVDDEEELRRSLRSILESSFKDTRFYFEEAANGVEALQKVRSREWDFILMDVRMPEMDGIEALKRTKEHDPSIFVLIMTAHGNLQDAVRAIKEGAFDYVEKPIEPVQLTQIVKKALEAKELVSRITISNPIFDDDIDSEFVGGNRKMREVFDLIHRLAKVETTVLLRGENGTGKELVARAIHQNSPRKHGEFVAINCGAIPENLMESELFGHEKGAFTGASDRKIGKFQLANQGTLFLDEVAELRPDMQVKLLRVLQEKRFVPVGSNREIKTNARIIAATNRNLEKMIEEGLFREDLFYRLNVMPIFLPPLRDRLDDLEDLLRFFLQKFAKQQSRIMSGVDSLALQAMKNYKWPGNIRELENVIERAFIVENSNMISFGSLPDHMREAPKTKSDVSLPYYSGPLDFDRFKEQSEKEFIIKALRANKGKINKTVALANIPKNTLLRKIKRYGIDVRELNESQ